MEIVTVIPDFAVGDRAKRGSSLLAATLGTGTVLDRLCDVARRAGSSEVWVLPDPSAPDAALTYDLHLGELNVTSVSVQQAQHRINRLEPSDQLLVLDPRHWGPHDFDIDVLMRESRLFHGAIHIVAAGSDAVGAQEQVICDEAGRVKRIRRLYSRVTQVSQSVELVMCSLVPVAGMQGIALSTPGQMRRDLAGAHVLSRDIPDFFDPMDMRRTDGYLTLAERVAHESLARPLPAGYSKLGDHVLVGRGALIHESARLAGQIIIQPGAVIECDVTIIGPTTIGAGSVIGRGAIVAQSVLPGGSRVGEWDVVRHCIRDPITLTERNDEPASMAPAPDDQTLDNEEYPHLTSVLEELDVPVGGALTRPIKRAFDVTASLIALVALFPLLVLVVILIKVDSRGPVFFIHRREGRRGKVFGCIKFRTMRAEAHRMQRRMYDQNMVDGPHFKLRHDPRVTRVGQFLRKMNIDELPQLINVLLGHMSLVGPRPSPFRENQFCVLWRRARLSVRPGLTGFWQICSRSRNAGDFQEWIYYDIAYVRNMSLWVDIKTILATVLTLTTRTNIQLSWLIGRGVVQVGQNPEALDGLVSAQVSSGVKRSTADPGAAIDAELCSASTSAPIAAKTR